ncbi:MAG: aldehyde dehydrogenase family protein [Deltaproteobacteria bacterium]|nr:aldehyde dehydrogenase family protein [Deltaproteobacteria bacterium]
MEETRFKLTYATMFDPPDILHTRFEAALAKVRADLGKEHAMIVAGKDRYSAQKFNETSPADTDVVLGIFQQGTAQGALDAVETARRAFAEWSGARWQDRVTLLRKAAALVEERIFDISAAMALSVGKNRMESLGEVAETADLINYACDQIEQNDGFVKEMGQDPIKNCVSRNLSVLRPHGAWLIISPFNFPIALTGGPAAAALVTGNTVIIKPPSDAPWTVRLLADCFQDAGLPDGVVNFVTGSGSTVGEALISSSDVDGVTFTGSYEVGMKIFQERARLNYARPVILEMGGKNPTIVSRNADLEIAALGTMRSAFGLQGQKCSACSRVYIEEPVYDDFVSRLVDLTGKIVVGDPTQKHVYMGPVINRTAFDRYRACVKELSAAGKVFSGGQALDSGEYARGYFCSPTIVADVPRDHRLWIEEMFVPILMVSTVADLSEAMEQANQSTFGLTAGFYGSPEEADWFFTNIRAGVAYANRLVGATTGAWPGFQPFGGWKGSGASGKNAGGHYYLPLYLREQIQSRMIRQ